MNNYNINQIEIDEVSNKKRYFSVIESLLFVSGEPLKLRNIASIIDCSENFTKDLMKEFCEMFENDSSRGVKIAKVNNAYQFVTKSENSDFIQNLLKTNIRQSLSQAALETLAIIAYKQPITRIDIEEIRGVKSDRAVYTLSEKKLIKESGRKEVPGRPILYVTTGEFLKHFELENLDQLPSLESYIDDDINDINDIDNIEDSIKEYINKKIERK
jgi:segregation and condensation protein B